MSICVAVVTVADCAQSVVVLHTLADDPPLREHRVGADGVHIECAPSSQQFIGADVALAASDGEVPVGQGKSGVAQHVLLRWRMDWLNVYFNQLLSYIPLLTLSIFHHIFCRFPPP